MSGECKTCKYAVWQLTAKGNPKRTVPGRCTYPTEQIEEDLNARLPSCCGYVRLHVVAIWRDYKDCPVWEATDDG